MAGVTIVALPEAEERVNKISSEKQAHLTLLHFGEIPDEQLADLTLYVQHAAEQFNPFYMTVDYRGELGDKRADVLFFEKDHWDFSRVAKFRNDLLLNDTIKLAFDSSDQFPDWIPHLTLGFPETPAHTPDEESDRKMFMVSFDRIAVWVEDSDGPTFRLKHRESMMSDTAMHAAAGESFIGAFFAHYGKKGMKWGVRNDNGHQGEAVKTKKLDKLDAKWEKGLNSTQTQIAVHNRVADKMNNGGIDKFNNEPRWKKAADDGHLTNDDHPETKAYFDAYEKLTNDMFADAYVELGSNPSGTKRFEIQEDSEGNRYAQLVYTDKTVQHAGGDTDLAYSISRSEDGTVASLKAVQAELKHYGVKGMRWGVSKKDRASEMGPQEVVVTQQKPGTFVKTSGGQNHQAHQDAINAQGARQKAKASTTDALSNQELQAAVNRMRLEQEYAKLDYSSDRRSAGQRFISGLFNNPRYNGEKIQYRDSEEQNGLKVRKALDYALSQKNAED